MLKLLPALANHQRLITAGATSEGVLHDEDFVEVHRKGSFGPADIEEIRQAPEDEFVAAQLEDRRRAHIPLTPPEQIWKNRRKQVGMEISRVGIRTRVVASSSRMDRWYIDAWVWRDGLAFISEREAEQMTLRCPRVGAPDPTCTHSGT
jgi:hypothetical protein